MTYQNTVAYLYGLQRQGIKLGLEPVRMLLARLNHPQKRFFCFHVGGTNGKGSTAVIVASILEAAGYRVGLYTSPHLLDFSERIRVQDVPIAKERIIEGTQRIRQAASLMAPLTFFECTTALAFQYFAEEHVDVAVIEVGLGGRLDATNVVNPLAVVITNIAWDHEEYLGRTLSSIAYEKAGIIQKGCRVVLGPLTSEAQKVIQTCVRQQNATAYRFGVDYSIQKEVGDQFHYHGISWDYSGLTCELKGDHQRVNGACALALLETADHLSVSESAVRKGLADARWPGRMEYVAEYPSILLDGAHNPAAADVLASYLVRTLDRQSLARLVLVIGMMRDKNHAEFLKRLVPLADHVILTQANLPRAAPPHVLKDALPNTAASVSVSLSCSEALKMARWLASSKDLICITGSLRLIGEMKTVWQGHSQSMRSR